jgi:hypothetical protein
MLDMRRRAVLKKSGIAVNFDSDACCSLIAIGSGRPPDVEALKRGRLAQVAGRQAGPILYGAEAEIAARSKPVGWSFAIRSPTAARRNRLTRSVDVQPAPAATPSV